MLYGHDKLSGLSRKEPLGLYDFVRFFWLASENYFDKEALF